MNPLFGERSWLRVGLAVAVLAASLVFLIVRAREALSTAPAPVAAPAAAQPRAGGSPPAAGGPSDADRPRPRWPKPTSGTTTPCT